MKIILFYGPLWYNNKRRIGGSETGNKRTNQILNKLGFKTILLNKPYYQGGLFDLLKYPFELIITYLKFIWKLATAKVDSFHLSAFYFSLIYIECVFILTCKIFRVKSIYELRAGGADGSYINGSSFYRFVFRLTVKQADVVMCQGKKTIELIKEITGVDSLYYPNYVMDDAFIPYPANNRDHATIVQLVYFGRIVPSKNVEFILDICHHLKTTGLKFNLEIIGDTNGNDAYLEKLKNLITQYEISDSITLSGAMNTESLLSLLVDKHFFLFPTVESREGHSNSLTEALSRGVVPIVSNIGFNKSIVDNDILVIETLNSASYADTISMVWTSGKWKQFSQHSYQIIATSFTESAVTKTLDIAHNTTSKAS